MDKESEMIWDADVDVAEGLIANNSGTSIKVEDDYASEELNVPGLETYGNSIVTIDATDRANNLQIIGNSNANVITLGVGDTTVDGGAGADKIYGGDGNDLFLYTSGQGRDTIYNYDGENGDEVSLGGVTTLDNSAFVNLGNGRVNLDLGADTLYFADATTMFKVRYADQVIELDLAGLTFSSNRQNVTIDGNDYNYTEFDGSQYSRLQNIYAREFSGEISIVGNDNNNIISVGSGDAIMDGGAGTDKLYGGEGDDVFIYTLGSGGDTICYYNGEDNRDEVRLIGVDSLDNSMFVPLVNGNVYLDLGNDTLNFYSVTGEMTFSYGDGITFTYNPNGLYFSADRRTAYITNDYNENTFDATNYSRVQTINAASDENSLELLGNSLDNTMYIGIGGGTLDGGEGNDRLYGDSLDGGNTFVHTVGAGRDTIFNYNGDDDQLVIYGIESLDNSNILNLGNGRISIVLGTDTLTFVNASGELQGICILDGAENSFRFNPDELIYNANRTAVTITNIYEDSDFDASEYSALKTINGALKETELNIYGNSLSNVMYAGSGGGILNGGAGSDELHGGEEHDVFVHTVGAGRDTIYNYDEDDNDELQIYGVTGALEQSAFVPIGNGVMLIDLGTDTLTLVNYSGTIVGQYGETDATTQIEAYNFTGVTLSAERNSIAVDDSFDAEELDVTNYGGSIATIDARNRTTELGIIGTSLSNDISLGSGGGSVDGGAGSDKICGGSGADIYVHSDGGGNDTIYNFDASNEDAPDQIQAKGLTELDKSAFEIGLNGVVRVSLGNDTLTLINPVGDINVVDEDGGELAIFNADGTSLASDKLLIINNSYKDTTVDGSNYSSELETINAVSYTKGELSIVGNANDNVIRAGSGGSTMDGGAGSDKLFGDTNYVGADYFVWSVGAGRDSVYNFCSTLDSAQDKIVLMGDYGEITDENFNEVGTTTTLSVGNSQLIIVNPHGKIEVVDENDGELHTYALPDGLSLSSDKKTLIVTDEYGEDVLNASDYNSWIETVTARTRTAEIEINGNDNDNGLRAGSGGSTLDGGLGNDKLYGGAGVDWFRYSVTGGGGSGSDTIYDFDASNEENPDVINISGIESLSTSAIRLTNGNNVEIDVGNGKLTLVDPIGAVTIVNDDGEEMLKFDTTGASVSADARVLNIGANYNDTVVDSANYSSLVATINASTFPDELYIIGNANTNVIKAGPGGSTMDGMGYNDYLYGNTGRDVFRYTSGEGSDYIYNYNSTVEGAGDVIQLIGINSIDKTNFRDTSNGTTVIQLGNKTLTLIDPIGAISVYGSEMYDEYDELVEPIFVYGKSLQAGVTYNFNKTKLTIAQGADLEEEEDRVFNVDDYSNNLRNIDASKYEETITLNGSAQSNEFYAGLGGSSLNGGGGFDKLYGGSGADTFAYVIGEGNDYINNYDSSNEEAQDIVQVFGDLSGVKKSSFRDSGKNTILTLGTNQLTFVNPKGSIIIVDANEETVITYDSTLESGVSYNENKSELTIGRNAELEDPTIDMATLSNNLRKINGTNYEGELNLVGNDKANELRAGSGGSTLDGREGTDKLYGGDGVDIFVISVGGGNDQIYSYNGDQGDLIMLIGDANLTKANFQDSNENTFLKLGTEKVMLSNPIGAITVVDEDESELIVYGQSLPSGVRYENNKTRLVIGSNAELDDNDSEFAVEDYVNNLRDIDASSYAGEIVLQGDERVNELRAGSGGSSLNGGLGNDNLYGGAGEDIFAYEYGGGNDVIYNYNGSAGDIVQLYGIGNVERSDFRDSNGNVILSLGSNNLTFVNATGPIILQDEGGNELEATYEELLPSGLTYNTTRTKLTVGRVDELANNVLDMATLSNNLRDIDASRYEHMINLLGNDKVNELHAGSGGSSLDGRSSADKLYGGSGADTYVVSVGGGNDIIYNYNGEQGDVIQVFGIDTITKDDFQDSGSNVILKVGSERVLINNPTGTITVVIGDDLDRTTYGSELDSGVRYSTDKTTLTINRGADLGENKEFDMATLSNSLRNIDASAYEGDVILIGNNKNNELKAGAGGATLDGGDGSDKLYGGAGNDEFVYSLGGGSDYIYNFDGDYDVIRILGDNVYIDDSNFRDNGQNVIVRIGNNRLTLVNPRGQIVLIDEDDETLGTYNTPLPDGVYYNSNKTKLTVSEDADLGTENVLDMETLANNLKEIDAVAYTGEIAMLGNDKVNILRGGVGGSSLNGGRGADKLYGGSGVDTFAYNTGDGSDYIYNFDGRGDNGDILQLYGVPNLDETAVTESGQNVIITIGSDRLTLVDALGQIRIVDENEMDLLIHNANLSEGLSYNTGKTKLIISDGANLESPTVRVSDYVSTLRDVDGSSYDGELHLIGNEKSNELYAGVGGATLDGGEGNDKLYGNTGADVFVYGNGEGNDHIYNYDSTDESSADVVVLNGVSGVDRSDFRDSGKNTVLTIGSNRLTFVNPKGEIVLTDGSGNTLATYGANLPTGVSYNSPKTRLTIGANADLSEFGNVFDMETLSSNIKEIDAAAYGEEVILAGNSKTNILRAGSGGSSMDGGSGADKLYGGAGADTYVHVEGNGNDMIYNYDGSQGDVIQVFGINSIDKSNFRDSSGNVILTLGSERLTIVSPVGQISVMGEDGEEPLATYGEYLPSGVAYNNNKTKLTIRDGAAFEDNTLDMADYSNGLITVDASNYGEELNITGNSNANEIYAGSGGGSIDGGAGNDKLYGGSGADVFVYTAGEGSDRIYNYASGDVIRLVDVSEIDKTMFRDSGKNTVITIGSKKLTVVNPSAGAIEVLIDSEEEPLVYGKELPEGVSYNGAKSRLTIGANAELSENGNVFNVEDYSNNLKDINASKYAEEIELNGDEKANELRAGSGGSTLWGGSGNDKLYGGAGADVFVYSSGSDVIYNFDAEQDRVALRDVSINSSRLSGNDIVYSIGNGSLTLKNAAQYGLTGITVENFEEESEEQLPSEDYWFENDSAIGDPLSEILSIDAAIDLNFDQLSETFKPSIELTGSARKVGRATK